MPRPSKLMQKIHRYAWMWEPLENEPSFLLRSMFGAKVVCFDGKQMLCFSAAEEPWRGLLICTSREHHTALQASFPELQPHSYLGKWLYLPESAPSFESTGAAIVQRVRQRDPLIGVAPKPRRARGGKLRVRKP